MTLAGHRDRRSRGALGPIAFRALGRCRRYPGQRLGPGHAHDPRAIRSGNALPVPGRRPRGLARQRGPLVQSREPC